LGQLFIASRDAEKMAKSSSLNIILDGTTHSGKKLVLGKENDGKKSSTSNPW